MKMFEKAKVPPAWWDRAEELNEKIKVLEAERAGLEKAIAEIQTNCDHVWDETRIAEPMSRPFTRLYCSECHGTILR